MASFDEVRTASIKYFDGDELAADVFAAKYALVDKMGDYKETTPDQMHHRLAHEFARIEEKYDNPLNETEIYKLLENFRYVVPQGSPMSGVGNDFQIQSVSNCFVISSPEDSYGGILKTDQELVQLAKRRGGVGLDISTLRPKGLPTSNCAKTTDGIIVFMQRFSNSCREVAQNGRRGALMITLSCFGKNTQILTDDGWMSIQAIVDKRYAGRVWTDNGFKEITSHQTIADRAVYRVHTKNATIDVTADHEFMVHNLQTDDEYLKAGL